MSRYRLITFFLCFRPARNYAPGQAYWNPDGIISDQESPFGRFTECPIGPRANLRKESGCSSRDIMETTGAGPSGLLASAPGGRAWATPFCPFLAKTGGYRWDFCRDLFFCFSSSIQKVCMGLSTGVYLSSTRNDWGSFAPGST